ncbi:MAG: c-type cytochrome biogenesis protein CcsB [Chloroflexi bacterium RBG_13_57_8]|nr:MAG: c-type cytochrome biogenesis protein CcsB [Chloroflexi bacterium RBG_13_57_8]
MVMAALALALVTISIISRAVASGHGPFSNMYEFSLAFSWGIIIVSLFFLWRYRITIIGAVGLALALGMLIFASTLPSRVLPLVPALQQSVLLSVHVASAVISYGALAVGFSTAVIYLLVRGRRVAWLPQPELLENISYRTVIVGFPFLTLTIILGAVWANIAWGRPWGWDPKETASLVTWLIFAAYLHARIIAGWRGARSALLLVIGFLAILFTFFGNYIFSGLHSYG